MYSEIGDQSSAESRKTVAIDRVLGDFALNRVADPDFGDLSSR